MGLYNFQPRFIPPILAGEKTHTIRARRQHADKAGNTMHLYTGLRHPGAQLLMRVPCVMVESIIIATNHAIWIDRNLLTSDESQQLARRDGFDGFGDMMAFWDGRLPFQGAIFHWTPDAAVVKRYLAVRHCINTASDILQQDAKLPPAMRIFQFREAR